MARHLWYEMQFTFFSLKSIFSCVLSRWERNKLKIIMEFHLKKGKLLLISYFSFIWLATLLTNGWYEPNETFLLWSTFLLHQGGPKNHIILFLSPLSQGRNPLPCACSDLDLGLSYAYLWHILSIYWTYRGIF